jgi:hypothetical protein
MGFDLSGLNPTINIKHSQEYNDIIKLYGKDGWLDWSMDIPEATKDRYFELKDQFQEDNPGDYFRNNVWWWRPLWDFVCNSCDDFLTEKDMEKGYYNDDRKISKTKSLKIAKRLSKLIADGTVDTLERESTLAIAKAEAHNKEVRKEMDTISNACQKEHGEIKAPAYYPEPYKTQWHNAYEKEDWTSSYPFYTDNVKVFATFCQQSGGFTIC